MSSTSAKKLPKKSSKERSLDELQESLRQNKNAFEAAHNEIDAELHKKIAILKEKMQLISTIENALAAFNKAVNVLQAEIMDGVPGVLRYSENRDEQSSQERDPQGAEDHASIKKEGHSDIEGGTANGNSNDDEEEETDSDMDVKFDLESLPSVNDD